MKNKIAFYAMNTLLVLVSLLVIECLLGLALPVALPQVEASRLFLIQQKRTKFQDNISVPYLLYTPTPNSGNHNEDGYRGFAVPLRKRPGRLRILALGGSTTYGSRSTRANSSYPEQLEAILNERRPSSVVGVEVMNGGLPLGSSAELLTHYLFKYRYYRPDVVVINTGGNDAHPMTRPNYQPDYSHWKQSLRTPEVPTALGRLALRSRIISLVVVPMFFGMDLGRDVFITSKPPPAKWFSALSGEDRFPAFRKNLSSLIREIQHDGAKVFLAPFRMGKPSQYPDYYQEYILQNEKVVHQLAARFKVPLIPFPHNAITPKNWADRCHLNEKGSLEKAMHFAETMIPALWTEQGA